jgi:acetylornithine/succinyldiaminopimelate/putrescine aminotransferase
MPRVEQIGQELLDGLHRLREKHAVITEVRGKGLMLGIQLSCSGRPFVERALDHGLLLNCTHETVLRLLPPFILSSEQAREILRILDLVFVCS